MKKMTRFFLALTIFMVLFTSACSDKDTDDEPVYVTQAAPTPVSSQVTALAPLCAPDLPCAEPDIKDSEPTDTYCVQKIPYQNFSVEPDTVLEPLDPTGDFRCADSKTVDNDGLNVWTCTGKQLWTYQLKITNPACKTRSLVTYSDKCDSGLGYDTAENCCAPLTRESGFVIIKVNIGACP